MYRHFQVLVEEDEKSSSQSSDFICWSTRTEANSSRSPKSCCMIRPLELVLKAFIKTYINLMEKLFMFLWAWYSKRRNYQFWPLCNTFLHGKFANAGPFKKLGYCNCIGLWPLRKIVIFVYCTNCLETLIFRFCCDFRQKRIFSFL